MTAQASSDVEPLSTPRKVTSDQGRKFVQDKEGWQAAVYKDIAGNATVGWGHKLTAAEASFLANAYPDGIPEAMAKFFLLTDLDAAEQAVRGTIKNADTLSQSQFDALVSFAFNIGPEAFARSALARKINQGDLSGAAGEFLRWVYAGGKPSKGLADRRRRERDLFMDGIYAHPIGPGKPFV